METVVPDMANAMLVLDDMSARFDSLVQLHLRKKQEELAHRTQSLRSPSAVLKGSEQHLLQLTRRLDAASAHSLDRALHRHDALALRLKRFDPNDVLRRGYAIVRRTDGKVVSDAAAVSVQDKLVISFRDGALRASVTDKE